MEQKQVRCSVGGYHVGFSLPKLGFESRHRKQEEGGEDTAHGAFVSIAQTVERATVNRKATGSIPVRNALGDSWDSSDGRA